MPARSARISGSAVSGRLRCSATLFGASISTLSSEAMSPFTAERGSVLARSRCAFTAAASKGSPSWNFTPSRRVSTSVFGSVNSHEVARPGFGASVAGSKSTSVSNSG